MIYSKEKRREAKYTTIEDGLRILAILPPDMWRWQEVANCLMQGVINAANDPIDENLHNRDWFSFALTLLKDDPKQRDYEWSGMVERTLYDEREEKKITELFGRIVLTFRRFEVAYYDVHADLPFTERPGSHPLIAAIRKLRDDRNLKLFSCIDTPLSHYTPFVFLRLLETRETPFDIEDMFPSSFENGPTPANRILLDVEAMRDRNDITPDEIWEYIDSVAYSHGMVYRAEKNRSDESTNLMVNNPVLCENMRLLTEAPPELAASQTSSSEPNEDQIVKPWTKYLGTQGRFRISDEGRQIDECPQTYAKTRYVFPREMKPNGVVPNTLAYFFHYYLANPQDPEWRNPLDDVEKYPFLKNWQQSFSGSYHEFKQEQMEPEPCENKHSHLRHTGRWRIKPNKV